MLARRHARHWKMAGIRGLGWGLLPVLLVAQVVLLGVTPAQAAGCSSFPGGTATSAAWLANVYQIDPTQTPVTVTYEFGKVFPTSNNTLTEPAGNIIRADLYVCNSTIGGASNYAGVFNFKDTGTQPNWNSHDKVGFTSAQIGKATFVGRFFQQVGFTVGTDQHYTLSPILKKSDTDIADGPVLTVKYNYRAFSTSDGPVPGNGSCQTSGANYEAHIAQNGDETRGVWDDLKGGTISSLTWLGGVTTVKLTMPAHKTPIAVEVNDPITIENAEVTGYDGTFFVGSVSSVSSFTLNGPAQDPGGPATTGGTATRYYKSNDPTDPMPTGIVLAGLTEICAGQDGDYFAGQKLEPSAGLNTVRWEGESHVYGGMKAGVPVDVKWYQTMPCNEAVGSSFTIKMAPRMLVSVGSLPDDSIKAEGTPFVFTVDGALATRCPRG